MEEIQQSQAPTVNSNDKAMMQDRRRKEEPFIMLQKAMTLVTSYNKKCTKIQEVAYDNNVFFPKIPDLHLGQAMLLVVPREKWHNIIVEIFDGMDPPLRKQQGTNLYMNVLLPESEMTNIQKKRVSQIKPNLSAAIWPYLTHTERCLVCSTIQGMVTGLDYLYVYFMKGIEEYNEEVNVMEMIHNEQKEETACSDYKNKLRKRQKKQA